MNELERIWSRARRLAESGRFWKARQLCKKLQKKAPDAPEIHFLLGYCERKLKKHDKALHHLEIALKANPENPQVIHQIGCSWDDQGHYAEAEIWYRKAVQLVPGWSEAWCGLGDVCNNLGRDDEALACYQKALSITPALPGAAYNMAGVVFNDKSLALALDALEHAVRFDPKFPEAQYHLGLISWLAGDEDRSQEAMSKLDISKHAYLIDSFEYIRANSGEETRFFGTTCPTLKFAVDAAPDEGLFLEFGVNWGTTIRFIATLTDQPVHGFDSFEGIPEDWETEAAGEYSTYGNLPEVPDHVTLHKGWFSDTLPAFFSSVNDVISLANIDCDIYSSTVDVLKNTTKNIGNNTVFVFDEYFGYKNWKNHEYKAFKEYTEGNNVNYEYLAFGVFSNQVVLRICA